MVKGMTIRKRKPEKKTKTKTRTNTWWQGIAEQLLDEKGHCGRDDIPDEADMRRQVAVTSMLVCGLKREAGYRPQGAVQAHTGNKVEQKVKIQCLVPDAYNESEEVKKKKKNKTTKIQTKWEITIEVLERFQKDLQVVLRNIDDLSGIFLESSR